VYMVILIIQENELYVVKGVSTLNYWILGFQGCR
jgi:hypothetical protein